MFDEDLLAVVYKKRKNRNNNKKNQSSIKKKEKTEKERECKNTAYIVPNTLERNVAELQNLLFDIAYKTSATVTAYSKEIAAVAENNTETEADKVPVTEHEKKETEVSEAEIPESDTE